jgi:hypothetical protein
VDQQPRHHDEPYERCERRRADDQELVDTETLEDRLSRNA